MIRTSATIYILVSRCNRAGRWVGDSHLIVREAIAVLCLDSLSQSLASLPPLPPLVMNSILHSTRGAVRLRFRILVLSGSDKLFRVEPCLLRLWRRDLFPSYLQVFSSNRKAPGLTLKIKLTANTRWGIGESSLRRGRDCDEVN
jgi:hypothetical protein